LRPDSGDRDQGDAQRQSEFTGSPGRGRRQRLARLRGIARRHREARAVAAEHEGKFVVAKRIGHRGDHRGTRHVDRLVAFLGDRLGRLRDVGDANRPVVRQRRIARRVHQAAEGALHAYAGIKGFAVAWRGHDATHCQFYVAGLI
jgi:hypothetical protein